MRLILQKSYWILILPVIMEVGNGQLVVELMLHLISEYLIRSHNKGNLIKTKNTLIPVYEDYYFIVADKCTECKGFHEEPQCAAVCPVDCCLPDPERVETEEVLLDRQARLHQ